MSQAEVDVGAESGAAAGPGRGVKAGVGVALLALAGLIAWNVTQMAPPLAVGVGPTAAMRIVAVLLAVLGLCHFVAAWRTPARHDAGSARGNQRAVAWVVAGLAGMIAALVFDAGFILGATWLFVTTAKAFGTPLRSISPVIGLVLSSLVYLFFTQALTLSLPAGPLERLIFG